MAARKTARKAKKAAKGSARQPRAAAKKLTPKQTAFVAEYMANGFNGTQAAIAAGYSKKNADTQASRMLAQPLIAAAVAAAKAKRLAEREITAEWVLDQIASVAELPITAIKMSDKLKSLELLGRYLKLFTDKVEHTGTVGVQLVTSVPRPVREKQIPSGNDQTKP